jgi:hypothetical protein
LISVTDFYTNVSYRLLNQGEGITEIELINLDPTIDTEVVKRLITATKDINTGLIHNVNGFKNSSNYGIIYNEDNNYPTIGTSDLSIGITSNPEDEGVTN